MVSKQYSTCGMRVEKLVLLLLLLFAVLLFRIHASILYMLRVIMPSTGLIIDYNILCVCFDLTNNFFFSPETTIKKKCLCWWSINFRFWNWYESMKFDTIWSFYINYLEREKKTIMENWNKKKCQRFFSLQSIASTFLYCHSPVRHLGWQFNYWNFSNNRNQTNVEKISMNLFAI